jgi:asparagine synthase (glutamine-hydrolysing)
MSLAQPSDLLRILNPDLLSSESNLTYLRDFKVGEISSLDRMIRADMKTYLPGDLLVKADIATMANGLELRSPFLDDTVVEWGLSLPKDFKVKGFETKHILKDVARSLVPASLIDRPKMGFGIPRAEWLRTGLRELLIDTLTGPTSMQRAWFDPIEVKRLIELHLSGEDMDSLLWPMMVLELWARNWLD